MVTIVKYSTSKGETRYRVRYRKPDGTQTDRRGFKRKVDAETWAAEHVTIAKARGTYIDPQDGKAVINDLGEAYLAKKLVRAKASYAKDLHTYWNIHVKPYWGNWQVAAISRSDIQEWVRWLQSGDEKAVPPRKPKSSSTVLHVADFLRGILQDAVRDRRIPANPCDGVELPRKRRRQRQYLTPEQLFRLADECKWRRNIVLTLGLCGMRWGELVHLRVRDVDLDRHRLLIRGAAVNVNGEIVADDPKTYKPRSVMFPAVLDEAMREQCEGKTDDDLLFTRPYDDGYRTYMVNGESPSRKNGGWLWFAERRAGVPFVTIHDLRHTAASIMVHAGANVKAVQRQLGHASAAMTLDVYADLFDDDLDALSESIGELLLRENVGKMWADNVGEAA